MGFQQMLAYWIVSKWQEQSTTKLNFFFADFDVSKQNTGVTDPTPLL
jgi:hypothetical protein